MSDIPNGAASYREVRNLMDKMKTELLAAIGDMGGRFEKHQDEHRQLERDRWRFLGWSVTTLIALGAVAATIILR